ncbi:MAG: hypothetical protein LBT51_11265 [Fusobacteriaceae bacterium]|nr:hypothetical protein [Fusobacteriaceae bacterium]
MLKKILLSVVLILAITNCAYLEYPASTNVSYETRYIYKRDNSWFRRTRRPPRPPKPPRAARPPRGAARREYRRDSRPPMAGRPGFRAPAMRGRR